MLTCMNASRGFIRRSAINHIQRQSIVQFCLQQRTIHTTASNSERIQGLIYKENGDPRGMIKGHVWDINTNDLKEGEIFVKIGKATVNPADINVIQGRYPAKPKKQSLPGIEEEVFVGGNEGFGIVKKLSKKGNLNGLEIDDWVIFAKPQMGTWRTGLICNANDVIKIKDLEKNDYSTYMASTLQVNPATAYRMLHDFHQLDPTKDVIIQNAANSAVGRAVAQIASGKLKVASINFVRNRPDFEKQREIFASYSKGDESCKAHLFTYEDMEDRTFKEKIKTIIGDKKINLGLNAVCGPQNANMAKLMGKNSTLVTYGAMSKQPLSIPAGLIIFNNMSIRGFMMNKWYEQNGLKEREELMKTLLELYKDKIILTPNPKKKFNLEVDMDIDQLTNAGKTAMENAMGSNVNVTPKVFFRFNNISGEA